MAENALQLTVLDNNEKISSSPQEIKQSCMDKDVEDPMLTPEGETGTDVESEEEQINRTLLALVLCRRNIHQRFTQNRQTLTNLFKILLFIGLCLYIGFAFHHSFGDEQSLTLLGIVCFGVGYYILSRCLRKYGKRLR
ncbi:hypothetical protein PoB_006067000 [Plakobranchus ocellatus]|uniref:Uncharacterized protein n=1 Tax=Plakobranchus ocellatus TaxID=259542 RepID=A0AAV4CQN4_9GAST|nr:hypothetical protein PoB_006067000 [Plakobranchus ocellatus]